MSKRKAAPAPDFPQSVQSMPPYQRALEHRAAVAARLAETETQLAAARQQAGAARTAVHDAEVATWIDDTAGPRVTLAQGASTSADATVRELEQACATGKDALRAVDASLVQLERELLPLFEQQWHAAYTPLATEFGRVMLEAVPLMRQMFALWEIERAPTRRAGDGITNPPPPLREFLYSDSVHHEHYHALIAAWLRAARAYGCDLG